MPRSLPSQSSAYENIRWYNGVKLSELTEGNDDEQLDGTLPNADGVRRCPSIAMDRAVTFLFSATILGQNLSITVHQNLIRLSYSRGILTGM